MKRKRTSGVSASIAREESAREQVRMLENKKRRVAYLESLREPTKPDSANPARSSQVGAEEQAETEGRKAPSLVPCPRCRVPVKEDNLEDHLVSRCKAAIRRPHRGRGAGTSYGMAMSGRCTGCGGPVISGDSVCYRCSK